MSPFAFLESVRDQIPAEHYEPALDSLERSRIAARALFWPSLLAPVVCAWALLFRDKLTGWLPAKYHDYDNEVSNFGDADWIAQHGEQSRTYGVMWRWIGLRNRAMHLSARLGMRWIDPNDREVIAGDPIDGTVDTDRAGWQLIRGGTEYQLLRVKPVGLGLCTSLNCGIKVWGEFNPESPYANRVWKTWSLVRWKGTT